MKYLTLLSLITVLFSFPTLLQAKNTQSTLPTSINVLAPTSMTNVLTQLISIYSTKGNFSIAAHFDSPTELIADIEGGDSADIIMSDFPIRQHLSAPPSRMDDIHNQGLIEIASRTKIIANQLTLVVSKHHSALERLTFISSVDVRELIEKLGKNTLFIVPDPDTEPAGIYFKEAMITLGYWKKIKSKLIRASNNRNALHLIAEGHGIGFVYHSDAIEHNHVVILGTFPPKSHTAIIYEAAVVASPNMHLAREFLTFLSSKQAQQIFREYGFTSLESAW